MTLFSTKQVSTKQISNKPASSKQLPKALVSGVLLGSILGLTACQNMPAMPKAPHSGAHPMPPHNMDKPHHDMNKHHHDMNKHHHNMDKTHLNAEQLSEGQILKVLSVANQGEIMQAQVAMPNLQMPEVRSYAQNMVEEHTDNENKGMALGGRLGLAPTASHTSNALQTDSNTMVTKLSQATMPTDKDYIMGQIMVHDKVLKTIDTQLMPSAQTPELRQFLAQTRAAVAMHLEMAKKLDAAM